LKKYTQRRENKDLKARTGEEVRTKLEGGTTLPLGNLKQSKTPYEGKKRHFSNQGKGGKRRRRMRGEKLCRLVKVIRRGKKEVGYSPILGMMVNRWEGSGCNEPKGREGP